MSVPHDDIQVAHDGPVATVTLNRPEVLNACSPDTHRHLQETIARLEADASVRVILLRGAGRAFCSGSDLNIVGKLAGRDAQDYIRLDFSTKARVAACAKPVIAVLHGHVAGGGFELALSCDMRIVADNVQFSLPEITLGTIPGAGGLQRLPQIVGLGIAKEWAMTGRRIGAEEAHLRGLSNAVHSLDALQGAAMAFAQELAKRSPVALQLCKVALDPAPPATDGLVGIYHRLASEACHNDPAYKQNAGRFDREKSS